MFDPKKVQLWPIEKIVPYEKNPRFNDNAVDSVAESIKQFGWKQPIVVDKKGTVVVGHTRLKAAKKLGMKEAPIIYADDLTPDQVKAYRLADNKTNEIAEWDFDKLEMELDDINMNMEQFGFVSDGKSSQESDEESYSHKIEGLIYEPTGERPVFEEMCDTAKYNELVNEIKDSDISEEDKYFLTLAAARHIVFSYRDIANFYAHSNRTVQDLMEKSALVIIDYEKAIENGFVNLHDTLCVKNG